MQLPLVHCPVAVQGLPFAFLAFVHTPLPSQNRPWSPSETQAGAPNASSSPAGTFEHTPRLPFRLQTLHTPVQAVSQHTPSTQLALAQSPNALHAWPLRLLHCWAESHAWSPAHVSSGSPATTLLQVPSLPATLQARQVAGHAASWQHTPSTQLPELQREAVPGEQAA